jgi:hypothetical protein
MAIFTKFDAFETKAYGELKGQGKSAGEARAERADRALQDFTPLGDALRDTKYPPARVIRLSSASPLSS